MKIVSWNCQGGFREKYKNIERLEADIYVIQECTDPEASRGTKYEDYCDFAGEKGKDYYWIGDEPSEEVKSPKGLGIFIKNDIETELISNFYPDFKFFQLIKVKNSFNLMGVWAMPKYVEMIHDFFDANEDIFDENLIMCGDFNSNHRFNYKHRKKDENGIAKDHDYLEEKLNGKGLYSVYHKLTNEKNGKESRFTFFQAKHLNYPFYLDYVYAGEEIIDNAELLALYKRNHKKIPNKFEILDHSEWTKKSDHLPVVLEIGDKLFE